MCSNVVIEKLDLILNKIDSIEKDISFIKEVIGKKENIKESNITNEVIQNHPIISELNLTPNLIDMSSTIQKKTKTTKSSSTRKPTNKYAVSKNIDEKLRTLLNISETKQSRESLKQRIIELSTIYGMTITIPSDIANVLELESSTMSIVEFEKLMNKIFE